MRMKTNNETYLQAYTKAAAYCSIAEHCEQEVKDKMRSWDVPEEMVEDILVDLKEGMFIDELRYCNAFVADKLKHNKWGRIKIRYELSRKRLPSTFIQEAMINVEEEGYIDMAYGLMSKKLKDIKAKDAYERKQKLFRFMAGRGFELDIIEIAYAKLMAD